VGPDTGGAAAHAVLEVGAGGGHPFAPWGSGGITPGEILSAKSCDFVHISLMLQLYIILPGKTTLVTHS